MSQSEQPEVRIAPPKPCPVRFPPGEDLMAATPLYDGIFAHVDSLLEGGRCPDGRFELETGESRLTCLIRRSRPFLAGLAEGDRFSRVPLCDFPLRVRQLRDPVCYLTRTDASHVMMAAVHFCRRPSLQASTRLVNPEHVLKVLEEEQRDAALAFEREGTRTLLFVHKGRPSRIFFGNPEDDPLEGDVSERWLLFAFAPSAAPGRVEVFTRLGLPADPDAGTPLVELFESSEAPPPVSVTVRMADGREILQRGFIPPEMTIGRDRYCDLFVDNLAVSRRHARLLWERGRFVIEDLGSANGTSVNGRQVTRENVLPGDRIGIGKFELSLASFQPAASVSETVMMSTRGAALQAFLTGKGVEVSLERGALIGKGEGVDVRARGLFVRPVHARIENKGPGIYRLTCFGRAKVRVNGRKKRTARVDVGDHITVGKTELRIEAEADGAPG